MRICKLLGVQLAMLKQYDQPLHACANHLLIRHVEQHSH